MAEKEKKGTETKIIPRQHEEEELSLPHVDDELVTEQQVLLRLPAKSLMRFKCVSKLWLSLITDNAFIAKYQTLKHGSLLVIPPNSSRRAGFFNAEQWDRRFFMIDINKPYKCRATILEPRDLPYTVNAATNVVNGLICFYNTDFSQVPIYLYNLTTHEILKISPSKLPAERGWFYQEVHLCFDPINEEYKLLRMWCTKCHIIECEVLTLWNNEPQTWRLIDISGVQERLANISQWYGIGSSFCLDSFLYWIVTCNGRHVNFTDIAMVFDVEHEKLELIDFPQRKVGCATLANLRGQVSLVSTPSRYPYGYESASRYNRDVEITVWKLLDMKNCDGKALWGTKEVIKHQFYDNSDISCSEFGLVSCTILDPSSNIAFVQGYDLAARKPIKFKINNAQGKLTGYYRAKGFRPLKMVENIMPLKNIKEARKFF